MISSLDVLEELRNSWNGVRILRTKISTIMMVSFSQGALSVRPLADVAHNLPLFHAYAVLNDVLLQLRDEKHFECERKFLASLLKASKTTLPWTQFDLVKEGVDRRNDIAHKGILLPSSDCWKYISAVEEELVAWNVIDPE